MKKIKCVVKRPDEEFGHMTNISDRLENLQKTVGGNIKVVPLLPASDSRCEVVAIVNEERNMRIPGTIIICGAESEGFTDIPISFEFWKKFVMSTQEVRI